MLTLRHSDSFELSMRCFCYNLKSHDIDSAASGIAKNETIANLSLGEDAYHTSRSKA
jgi:hypothetical protein